MKRYTTVIFGMLALTSVHSQQEPKTIQDRITEFGSLVQARLAPRFEAAGIPYPPAAVTLIGVKQTRRLEVYASDRVGDGNKMNFICSYPILAASGVLGPKLREGDRQVPEGIYKIRELNPNSLFHLSLWIDYPNEFELARAAEEGRTEPGSEIMIHGGAESRGCVAVGDPAAEDLFVLAALTGIENLKVVLTPVDFRRQTVPQLSNNAPRWAVGLYDNLKRELAQYPVPAE